jgi:hypothetical protein
MENKNLTLGNGENTVPKKKRIMSWKESYMQ